MARLNWQTAATAAVLLAGHTALADTPAHCLYNQTVGTWKFYMTSNTGDNTITCGGDPNALKVASSFVVTLSEPNVAMKVGTGVRGTWTMVYDEGFELQIDGQSFFGFANYTVNGNTATSYCWQTQVSYFHAIPSTPGKAPRNWGCYYAVQQGQRAENVVHHSHLLSSPNDNELVKADEEFAAAINAEQSLWKASPHSVFEGMPRHEARRRSGSRLYNSIESTKVGLPRPSISAEEDARIRASLPTSWDWRNVYDTNYVCPVRNQGSCGSCYAFAATTSMCSRFAISYNITASAALYLSPQSVVSCSPYSQGCNGGFGFLVYRYAEDFGLPLENCFPYNPGAACQKCGDTPRVKWVTNHRMVGGYYGAATEVNMMQEIVTNGPISVELMVYPDFQAYTSGVYQHTKAAELRMDPWEATNHEVYLLGYGTTASGVDYWIGQNSWGTGWGMNGYFLIRRGVDECAIESIPSTATPVV